MGKQCPIRFYTSFTNDCVDRTGSSLYIKFPYYIAAHECGNNLYLSIERENNYGNLLTLYRKHDKVKKKTEYLIAKRAITDWKHTLLEAA